MPAKARVGNWQEELVYEADRKALLQATRENGALLSQKIVAKVRQHKTRTQLFTLPQDGILRFGAPIMLQNAETEGFLSVDIDDKASTSSGWRYTCTTAPSEHPMLRNTWVLLPVPSADDAFWDAKGETDVIHYGQKFVIQSVADLTNPPIYLSSELKSPSSFSKVSSNQEAYFSEAGAQAALWCFAFGNPEFRLEMEGQPVKANSVLFVTHTTTNTPLASTKARYVNDFGPEYEVCCNRFRAFAAKHGTAPEVKANMWAAVTAQ